MTAQTLDTPSALPALIAHATDLEPEAGVAFTHSVALAASLGAKLHTLHATGARSPGKVTLPDPERLLRAWGKEGNAIEHEETVHTRCLDPVDALMDAMEGMHPDLLVVGTHRVRGLERLIHESISESLAVELNIPTLFVPHAQEGFVLEDGSIRLRRVLIPAEDERFLVRAVDALDTLFSACSSSAELMILHVGKDGITDSLLLPETANDWAVEFIERSGPLTYTVTEAAEQFGADLIVMTTAGHDSLGDILHGTHTERVVRRSPCPVLAVPI